MCLPKEVVLFYHVALKGLDDLSVMPGPLQTPRTPIEGLTQVARGEMQKQVAGGANRELEDTRNNQKEEE